MAMVETHFDRAELLRVNIINMFNAILDYDDSRSSVNLLVVALEAMGDGMMIRDALEELRWRAPEREISNATDLIRALYEIGEDATAQRLIRRLAELKEGESDDALAGLHAIAKLCPHHTWWALGFAIECAQARAGAHPRPEKLLLAVELNEQGLCFRSLEWEFWGFPLYREAIRATTTGFRDYLLYRVGLGDEPELPARITEQATKD